MAYPIFWVRKDLYYRFGNRAKKAIGYSAEGSFFPTDSIEPELHSQHNKLPEQHYQPQVQDHFQQQNDQHSTSYGRRILEILASINSQIRAGFIHRLWLLFKESSDAVGCVLHIIHPSMSSVNIDFMDNKHFPHPTVLWFSWYGKVSPFGIP